MYKLCLNSRDELHIIDLEKIAFFQANGNYTRLNYITGGTHLLTVGLSRVEELIRLTWPKEKPSPFVRIGRSFIINQVYLSEISVLKQRLVLSDCMGHSHPCTQKGQVYRRIDLALWFSPSGGGLPPGTFYL